MSLYVCLIGKSGSGKSEIAKYFVELTAFTTREKRANEVHGRDYYFKDREFIKKEIEKYENGESDYIVEWGEYNSHYYGTLKEELDKKMEVSDCVINSMELSGALKMREKFGTDLVKLVWIDIDESIRIERLASRSTLSGEKLEDLKLRMNEDYRNDEKLVCDFIVENNGDVELAREKLDYYLKNIN